MLEAAGAAAGVANHFNLDSLLGGSSVSVSGMRISIDGGGAAGKAAEVRFDSADLYGAKGPQAADIRQDALGDCYFVATLGAVAQQQPDAIRNMISFDAKTGNFTVTLHDNDGNPQSVQVTQAELEDNLARQGGSTADNSGLDGPIWPAVAETAYAKIHDSNPADGLTEGYNAIANGGWPQDAMQTITGDRGDEIRYSEGFFESENSALDRMAGQVDAALSNDRPVTLWTVPENRSLWDKIRGNEGTQDGLVDNHVYTVEGVHKNADGEWMVTVRNPWSTNMNVGEGHDTASPTMEVPLRTLADTGGAEAFTVGPAPR